jgi:pimeloyl-ACP methyl ester carboxylesterase
MVPSDLLAVHRIGRVTLSPDGNWAAVVVERPKKPGESYQRNNLLDVRRSDVWLVSTDGGPPINLTRGEMSRAGYWAPAWSPDGKRLGMVSTNGGDNVRAYVYDFATRRLRRVTRAGVDLSLRIESQQQQEAAPIAWLGSTNLLVGVLPAGTRPLGFDEEQRTASITSVGLKEALAGRVPTAHVLVSGEPEAPQPPVANVSLTAIDVVTGVQRIIARIPFVETRLAQRLVAIAPTQQHAAIFATDAPLRRARKGQIQPGDLYPLRVGVVALGGKTDVQWISGVAPAVFGFGGPLSSLRWAATQPKFAIVGSSGDSDATVSFNAFVITARDARAEIVRPQVSGPATQLFAAEDVQWTNDGNLLVYGYLRNNGVVQDASSDSEYRTARRDWWLVRDDGSSRNVTAEMSTPPQRLVPIQTSGVMLSNSGGRLSTVDLSTGKIAAVNATDASPTTVAWPTLRYLSYPASGFSSSQTIEELLIVSPTSAGVKLYLANVSGTTPTWLQLGSMPVGASIREYSVRRKVAIYQTADMKLCAIKANQGEPITLLSLDRGLEAIATPQYRYFEYRSTDDKPLSGALLLPYDYVPGRRYPLVVRVYAGTSAPKGDWASPYRTDFLHPLLLASRGYAVLVPSMPLGPMGVSSDPMLELDKGVKPAIEKVVEMGIADPERLGIIGHSFGGYSVYGLITQTQRFKAAVALAGVTDVFGFYARLDERYRYSDGLIPLLSAWGTESQQMSMGVPPWTDPARYLRNSPYVYADRVTTPVLMIHGEIDSLPIAQTEQFFVALSRLNKRSKLVRYLGEGHGIESPANTLDMWQHILSWFDEFLMKPKNEKAVVDQKKVGNH